MKGFLNIAITQLGGFLISSLLIVGYRTILIKAPCDPKFECLCSFSCLLTTIATLTLILALGLSASFALLGRGIFNHINHKQLITFFIAGALLGAIAFVHPISTILIIYGGQLIIWLPLTVFVSLITIKLAKNITTKSSSPAKSAGLDRP